MKQHKPQQLYIPKSSKEYEPKWHQTHYILFGFAEIIPRADVTHLPDIIQTPKLI